MVGVLIRLAIVAAIAGALYGLWYQVDHWCNSKCVEQQEQITTLETQAQTARDRATALALLWAKELDNVKERIKERVVVRTQTFGGIRKRVGKIGNGVAIPVDTDTQRLLADIAGAANDTPAPSGGEVAAEAVPEAAGSVDTQLRDWVQFAADAGEAYRDAADKHMACVAAYEVLEKGNE